MQVGSGDESTSAPGSSSKPSSRKNSILVKEESSQSRANLQSAHPHFVEQILPHRSPTSSVAAPSGLGSQSAQEALARFHFQNSAQPAPATQMVPPTAAGPAGQSSQQVDPAAPSYGPDFPGKPQFLNSSVSKDSSGQRVSSAGGISLNSKVQEAPPALSSAVALAQAQADAQSFRRPEGQAAQHPPLFPPVSQSGSPAPSSGGQFGSGPIAIPGTSGLARMSSPGVPGTSGSDGEGTSQPITGRAASKQPSDPRIPMDDGKIHILLGVTGSLHVTSVKPIISKLQAIYGDRVAIQVVITPAADKLIAASSSAKQAMVAAGANAAGSNAAGSTAAAALNSSAAPSPAPGAAAQTTHPAASSAGPATGAESHALRDKESHSNVRVWHESDEWETWRGRNDPVIHIELRRWADILVIAPLSANTLGKIAMGLCDNLLTNVVRAWNAQYPILIAPAMVSYAYNHPATKHHLKIIKDEMKWIEILRPTEKVAGSTGGIGMGGMMPWNEIVDRIVHKLGGYPDDEDEDEDEDDDDDNKDRAPNANDDEDDDDDDDDGDILNEGVDTAVNNDDPPHGSPI